MTNVSVLGAKHEKRIDARKKNNFCGTFTTASGKPVQYLRFEVFTAVTMKNAVICDVTPCGCCKNRRFGGTLSLHHQVDNNR
jgi:hypothetical protein